MRHCTRKIERGSGSPEEQARALLVRGVLYANDERPEAALADLNAALALTPEDPRLYAYRSWVHAVLGRRDAAWADIAELERLAPNDTIRFFVRANVHEALGEFEQARRAYIQAVAALTVRILERPRFAFLYTDRAQALIALNRYDDALSDLQRSIELNPTDVETLRLRVFVLRKLGRREEAALAREQLREALGYPLSLRLLDRLLG
jgi:tetratricopeptide (TPR) repeat protein